MMQWRGRGGRSSFVLAVLVVGIAGVPSTLRAQAEPREYRAVIEQATAESSARRFEEARALYRRAHELYPNARTLRGIGIAAFELHDYVGAVRHLRLALSDARRPLPAEQRTEAEALVRQCMVHVASYRLPRLPADAVLTLDGAEVRPDVDWSLLVPSGRHTIGLRAGERSGSAVVDVHGGENEPLPAALREVAQEPEAAPAGPGETPADEAYDPRVWQKTPEPFPWLGASVTAAGGVVLLTGAVLLVAGLSDVKTVEDAATGSEWSDLNGAYERAPLLTGLGLGLLAAGAVTATFGVLEFTAGDDDADGRPDAVSMRVRGCF